MAHSVSRMDPFMHPSLTLVVPGTASSDGWRCLYKYHTGMTHLFLQPDLCASHIAIKFVRPSLLIGQHLYKASAWKKNTCRAHKLCRQPSAILSLSSPILIVCILSSGGFCASGFKRAFRMKDFGDTIPGHGGVTDRFDCQVCGALNFCDHVHACQCLDGRDG